MSFAVRVARRTIGRIYRDGGPGVLRDKVAEVGTRDEPVSINQRATIERRNGARFGWLMRGESVPRPMRVKPPLHPYDSPTIH